jgi:hypothetical protein
MGPGLAIAWLDGVKNAKFSSAANSFRFASGRGIFGEGRESAGLGIILGGETSRAV